MNPFPVLAIACGFSLLPFATTSDIPQDPPAAKANKYIGEAACKGCHAGKDKGEAHDKWVASQHAKAFETLASPKAKEIAAKLKIDDPQKSDQCLQCHVTAHGEPAANIKKSFKADKGVQCETCHGPGEKHQKTRMAEAQKGGAASPVTADEITAKRDVATCLKCHNEKSPTFTPFCFKERMEKIEHLDARKKRSEDEIKKLRETCYPECPKCPKEAPKDGK